MKYVAVSCKNHCEKLCKIIEALLGDVIFIDIEKSGIPGSAIGYDGPYHASVSESKMGEPWIDLNIASIEKAVKSIRKHCLISSKSSGLGDVISKITGLLGIKPCDGCKRRQALLNKWMPFEE